MSSEIEVQRDYWNREISTFGSIYSKDKSKFSIWLDKVFRWDMFERFAFTIQNCEPIEGRTFLDVGCGTGIFSIELAKKGAAKAVGLDIAENMVEQSAQGAEDGGVADKCSFSHSDLLEWEPDAIFDVTFGIGLFDYIGDALPVLKKMREVSSDKAIVSFPRFWTWRAPVRKLRLSVRGCPVYFFTKRRIAELVKQAGFARHTVTKVGKLHCVVAYCGKE